MSLHDVEAVRKVLRGGSVVDWKRVHLATRPAVGEFLRAAGFRPEQDADRQRLKTIQREAVQSLSDIHGFSFSPALSRPARVSDVFLAAAGEDGPEQRSACAILKVMHIIHHLAARELRHCLATADRELFDQVERRVNRVVDDLRAQHVGVVRLIHSRKEAESVVTKLLSKRRALSAKVYDRLRFRVVTRTTADIVPLLRHLTAHLFPFNYVLPEESRNDVVDLRRLLHDDPALSVHVPNLSAPLDDDDSSHDGEFNEHSASDYRMVAFVAEVPVRVDTALAHRDGLLDRLGPVVYTMVEFQVFDEATWEANERGAASHASYKARQRGGVLGRLVPGKVD